MDKYFAKLLAVYQNQSSEEKKLAELLFSEESNITIGDQRLNHLAALTYNATTSDKMFAILEKVLSPSEYPWNTLYKAILVLHTIVLYGSERAIDATIKINYLVYPLQDYNSALVKRKNAFLSIGLSGGTDYGAPVRASVRVFLEILKSDDTIRRARAGAREGQASLVPVGNLIDDSSTSAPPEYLFGQGVEKQLGAKFSMEQVPGLYEGRPERYFDNRNDPRNGQIRTGDHQFTRDAMAPDLLDLSYDQTASTVLPDAQFLPALQRQQELERQLEAQQDQLKKLQSALAQSASQAQVSQAPYPGGYYPHPAAPAPQGMYLGQPAQTQGQSRALPAPVDLLGITPVGAPFSSGMMPPLVAGQAFIGGSGYPAGQAYAPPVVNPPYQQYPGSFIPQAQPGVPAFSQNNFPGGYAYGAGFPPGSYPTPSQPFQPAYGYQPYTASVPSNATGGYGSPPPVPQSRPDDEIPYYPPPPPPPMR